MAIIRLETEIIALIQGNEQVEQLETGQQGLDYFKRNTIYAEKGGQKGDCGTIAAYNGGTQLLIMATKYIYTNPIGRPDCSLCTGRKRLF